ncbi:hypothetical protein [Serratia marcescens]|uniref:hypothetical protein n=1 Tax=Serratia marcescens TaxID=615 RepID=UPI0005A5257C|nr:hypothetical protein [Serratia marcescens]MDP8858677.1 hypothetical protein [Serratia marcescens]
MKTQMQIVQEAIARLELMSRDQFRASLVAAGAVEAMDVRMHFNASMSGTDRTEQTQPKDSEYSLSFKQRGQHRELSLVF